MTEELYPGIFRIGVLLPGNPLRELNSYFIRGEESDLLIDTGFRRPACREALEAGLKELGSDPARRDVLVTHLHSDHSGMADLFVGPGSRIFISAADLDLLAHHSRRIDNALSIVKDHPGLCAYEIAGIMKWKILASDWDSFPIIQKWFAVGECLSHLDYLRRRDRIRFEEEGGIRRYYAV